MSTNQQETPYAVLVHLSGERRGTSELLTANRVSVASGGQPRLTLEKRGHTYAMQAIAGVDVFVNGEPTEALVLASGDVLEIGDGGTVLRFRLYPSARGPYKSMREAFSDCIDCARYGGRGVLDKAGILLARIPLELATKTSPASRVAFFAFMLLLLTVTGATLVNSMRLGQRLSAETERIEGLAALLAAGEADSYSIADFDAARAELEGMIGESMERVEALEARAGAAERIIAAAAESIVFLQGSYGFVDPRSGQSLHFVAGPGGRPLRLPNGQNATTLGGDGPVVEVLYTGTGFVASDQGHVLTNRHVALPWLYDAAAQRIMEQGLQPVMQRLIGYLPGVEEPFDIEFVAASDTADVALLSCQVPTTSVKPLQLANLPPNPGDEVILMGYPTGVRALMARAGTQFVSDLVASGPIDFWQVLRRLSTGGLVTPLSTRGIVGQITQSTIVYDAATMSGGSGGPVINLDGEVVAINSAMVTGFTGSNLGVPAAAAARLLQDASPGGS